MNYFTTEQVAVYQAQVASELRRSQARARNGPIRRIRSALASSLVLTGARLLPETPAVVGDRVPVFERTGPEDASERKLQPAA